MAHMDILTDGLQIAPLNGEERLCPLHAGAIIELVWNLGMIPLHNSACRSGTVHSIPEWEDLHKTKQNVVLIKEYLMNVESI